MVTSEAVLLTEAEAGELCRVSAKTIQRWRKREGLPHVTIGQTVRIPADRLREWANTRAKGEAK